MRPQAIAKVIAGSSHGSYLGFGRLVNLTNLVGWAALAWAIAFTYLGLASDLPPVPGDELWERADLLGHLGASGLLACLVSAWLTTARKLDPGNAFLVAAASALALGTAIELIQLTRPARSFEEADAMANALGAVAGAWAYRSVAARANRAVTATRVVTGLGLVASAAVLILAIGS